MGPGDLQPVSLEIVDQHLAETAFLAELLFGGEGRARGFFLILKFAGRRRLVAVVFAFRGFGCGPATERPAFDETMVETKIAVVADRDDAAGAAAVLRRQKGWSWRVLHDGRTEPSLVL